MRRREFFGILGGAAVALPQVARAQRAMPVLGFLSGGDPNSNSNLVAAFHQGLAEAGFAAGRNVAIEYRWAEGRPDRLPALAAELIDQRVEVIVATPTVGALAAKAATSTVPIVFIATDNPVSLGLVPSLNRPGGNATGVNFLLNELGPKRLELLIELIPSAKKIGLLLNPGSPPAARSLPSVQAAAHSLGRDTLVAHLRSADDIPAAFSALTEWKADAAMVFPDGSVFSSRQQLAAQAIQRAIPAIYPLRDFVEAGGLVSYGTSITETFRQLGNYAGRILKGEKPGDLPVVQSTKFELVFNLKAAKAIGFTIPESFLLRADEVIE